MILAVLVGSLMSFESFAAQDEEFGQIQGGQRLTLDVPEPAAQHALLLDENGVDLVIDRPDLGAGSVANLPGRRWGRQVQVAWDLPPGTTSLVVRPQLPNAPAGTYRYRWLRVDPAERESLQWLSRAAESAPRRDRESTAATLAYLQQALAGANATLPADAAQLWYRVGQLHGRLNDSSAEQAAYRTSITLLGGRSSADQGLGHVLAALSMSLMRDGHLPEAARVNAAAAAAANRAGDLYQKALISNNGCVVVRASADMKAAAACFTEALKAYQAAGLVEHQSAVLTNLSAAYIILGDGHAALQALQQAIGLRDGLAGDDHDIAHAAALTHLAQVQARLGRFDEALQSGHMALALARRLDNDFWELQAVTVLALTHLDLGQGERAKHLLDSAVAGAANDRVNPRTLRLALYAVAIEPDTRSKVARLRELQNRAVSAGDDLILASAQLHWAIAAASFEPLNARLEALRGAVVLAERHGLVEIQILALATVAELSDKLAAERMLAAAEAKAIEANLPLALHTVYYAQARLASKRGDYAAGRLLVSLADRLEDELSLRMSARQRHEFQAAHRPRQQFALGLGADMASTERADWALQRLLRSRAQLWRKKARQQLAGEQVEYRQALERLSFMASLADSNDRHELDLESAVARVESLERSASLLRKPLRLSDIQGRLSPNDRLVLLAVGDPVSIAAVVSRSSLDVFNLTDAQTLTTTANSVRVGLSRQDPLGQKALARRMERLALMLAPAFQAASDGDRIYLLSDPLLDSLPVEVLAGADPLGHRFGRSYLRWAITAETGWFPPARMHTAGAQGLVLLYDSAARLGNRSTGLAALPNASLEVASIANMVASPDTLKLAGAQAAAWLTRPVSRHVGVLHIAAHAVNDSLSSANSALALAGDDAVGRVSLGALGLNALVADLTVLSGCSTGVGAHGDFQQGFAEAFIGAGSSHVMATLWPVDDEASAQFMSEFYRRLWAHDGVSPGTALAQTKEFFASSKRWRDPYWWAGYQLWSGGFGSNEIQLRAISASR